MVDHKKIIILTSIVILSWFILTFTAGCTQPQSHGFKPIVTTNETMIVYYIDVGQGDSELIKTPEGKTVLIDAGDVGSNVRIIPYLNKLNVTTIDTVIVSHPHADHIGGMTNILTKYKVNNFIESGATSTSSVYDKMLTTIENKKIPYKIVRAGDTINIDPEVKMDIIGPMKYSDNLNDNSVVVKMVYNNVSFLFTGDMEADVEKGLGDVHHIDILKVGHHGSSTSTHPFFIMMTSPSVSIISVGKDNIYGHPDKITLDNLLMAGSIVYRTDTDGTITVITDGNNYNITTEH